MRPIDNISGNVPKVMRSHALTHIHSYSRIIDEILGGETGGIPNVNDIYTLETYLRKFAGLTEKDALAVIFDCVQIFLNELDGKITFGSPK